MMLLLIVKLLPIVKVLTFPKTRSFRAEAQR